MSNTAELPMIDVSFDGPTPFQFSYANHTDPFLKKLTIRLIERCTGQRKLLKTYLQWSSSPRKQENIFAAGIRLLGVNLVFDNQPLQSIPATGPLLVVANHPYGVTDGLALGDIITRVRPDVKILTNSLLCQPIEFHQYMLPVDFSGTTAARSRTAQTRRQAVEWLQQGHAVAIFPAGGVATRQSPLKGNARDLPWHSFIGKLSNIENVQVQPIYFHGENSPLFHLASHTNYALRLALFFRETVRLMGKNIRVSIGTTIDGRSLPHHEGRSAVAQYLRQKTFGLAKSRDQNHAADYIWPARVKF
jgi:putative hemolysin